MEFSIKVQVVKKKKKYNPETYKSISATSKLKTYDCKTFPLEMNINKNKLPTLLKKKYV